MVRTFAAYVTPMNQRELDSVFSLSALEAKLVAYVRDADAASQPFDVSSVPKVSREQAAQDAARKLRAFFISTASHHASGPSSLDTIGVPATRTATPVPPSQSTEVTQTSFVQQLAQVPELASYGAILNSSKPTQLTENETEYQVSCIKHIFREHVVFQVCLFHALPQRLILRHLSLMCRIQCRTLFWSKSPLLCSFQLTLG